jgi:hypothetical protein
LYATGSKYNHELETIYRSWKFSANRRSVDSFVSIDVSEPHKEEELRRHKLSYWGLWQAILLMTTKQTTPYAASYRLNVY